MPSPLDDEFAIDKENRKPGRDPKPEVIILTHRKGLVEEANFGKKCPLHHHGRGADDTKREALLEDPPRIFRMLEHWVDSLPFANPDLVGVAQGIMGIVIQESHLCLQLSFYPKIIRIQKGDIFASCMKNPFVSGSTHPFVYRMLKQLNSSSVSLYLFGSPIGGPIIDNGQLHIFKILSKDRIHRLFQHGETIIG